MIPSHTAGRQRALAPYAAEQRCAQGSGLIPSVTLTDTTNTANTYIGNAAAYVLLWM